MEGGRWRWREETEMEAGGLEEGGKEVGGDAEEEHEGRWRRQNVRRVPPPSRRERDA